MTRVPKWFKKYLETNKIDLNLIIIVALITGFTSFGLPQPPKIFRDFLSDYPWFKWVMLWLLIYQGGSGQDFIITNIAFGVLFTFYNLDWDWIISFMKKNKRILVLLSPVLIFLYKN